MNDRTAILLQRLEQGYRNDSEWLKKLGQDFQFTLESARRVGEVPAVDDAWKQTLQRHWGELDTLLQRMNIQLQEIQTCLEKDDKARLASALNAWHALLPTEGALEEALVQVRAHMGEQDPAVRRDWNTHERLIKNHLQTFQATVQAIRTKLRLLTEYSSEALDPSVRQILADLPPDLPPGPTATEEYLKQYRQAALDIQHEQHQEGGLTDTLKAMFLWVDSPEERLREKKVISKIGS